MDAKKQLRKSRKSSMAIISEANADSSATVEFLKSVKRAIEQGSIKDGSKLTIATGMFVLDGQNREFSESSDEFKALRDSIDRDGLVNPLTFGFDLERTELYLISGHRRLASVKQLGWESVSAIYRDEERDVAAIRFAENAFRENLEPIELCNQVKKVKKLWSPPTDVEFAKMLGFSRSKTIGCLKIAEWGYEDKEFASRNNIKLTPLIRIATKSNVNIRAELVKLVSKKAAGECPKPQKQAPSEAFTKSLSKLNEMAESKHLSRSFVTKARAILKKVDGMDKEELLCLLDLLGDR